MGVTWTPDINVLRNRYFKEPLKTTHVELLLRARYYLGAEKSGKNKINRFHHSIIFMTQRELKEISIKNP